MKRGVGKGEEGGEEVGRNKGGEKKEREKGDEGRKGEGDGCGAQLQFLDPPVVGSGSKSLTRPDPTRRVYGPSP